MLIFKNKANVMNILRLPTDLTLSDMCYHYRCPNWGGGGFRDSHSVIQLRSPVRPEILKICSISQNLTLY